MTLAEDTRAAADRLIARYPQPRSALLPLLYLVQAEHGYVTDEGIAFCAERLGLTRAEVQAVSSFYEMFEREDPGDWLLTVCVNFSCKVRGGQTIYDRWIEELGGRHDRDAGVTVKHLECLGNCEGAPVVQVNYQNYERVGTDQALELLAACRRGQPPAAVSGGPPPTFREVCWRLAGAEDADRLHAAAVRAAQADVASYERPPAQRIADEAKDLGSPGVRAPGPEVGDTTGVEPADRHDREAPAEQAPAGERLSQPARVPEADAGGRSDDADQEPAEEAPESEEQAADDDTAAPEEEGEPTPATPAVTSESGGTREVRRLDADPGRDEVHAPDAPAEPTPPRARPEADGDEPRPGTPPGGAPEGG